MYTMMPIIVEIQIESKMALTHEDSLLKKKTYFRPRELLEVNRHVLITNHVQVVYKIKTLYNQAHFL